MEQNMKIKEIPVKELVTKSNLPKTDYVINPYIGCQHSCIYCYADFMKRFTGHVNEEWGSFVDVKIVSNCNLNKKKYTDQLILISSVTDPYQPIENKYFNTRKILEGLKNSEADVEILTKSSLVTRDIAYLKKIPRLKVGISLNTLNNKIAKIGRASCRERV